MRRFKQRRSLPQRGTHRRCQIGKLQYRPENSTTCATVKKLTTSSAVKVPADGISATP
jgi:hypothetical protein